MRDGVGGARELSGVAHSERSRPSRDEKTRQRVGGQLSSAASVRHSSDMLPASFLLTAKSR